MLNENDLDSVNHWASTDHVRLRFHVWDGLHAIAVHGQIG